MLLKSVADFLYRNIPPFAKLIYWKKQQESRLLNLPPELLECVLENTSLADRILLSQTCKGLHHRLAATCLLDFHQKPQQERWSIRNDISQRLPEHRLCTLCRELHIIDFEESPYLTQSLSPSKQCRKHICYPFDYIDCFRFEITHHLVQIAIKLACMKEVRPKYRMMLQRPQILPFLATTLGGSILWHHKIVESHFILKVCCTFTPDTESPSTRSLRGAVMGICPHFNFKDTCGALHESICASFETFQRSGQTVATKHSFSCDYCPTDVETEVGNEYAKFFAWYDLGTGQYPFDTFWVSHSLRLEPRRTPVTHRQPKF